MFLLLYKSYHLYLTFQRRVQQLLYIDFQHIGYLKQSLQSRLRSVRTPFRYRGRIFSKLFSQPFVGSFLLNEYYFNSIYVFCYFHLDIIICLILQMYENSFNYTSFI